MPFGPTLRAGADFFSTAFFVPVSDFFAIPGLGSYLIEAISGQDFAIVRAMVFIGSFLYILGLILTDISYTLADPRIRLQ
jgi:peptide/nickel transport system permease protein